MSYNWVYTSYGYERSLNKQNQHLMSVLIMVFIIPLTHTNVWESMGKPWSCMQFIKKLYFLPQVVREFISLLQVRWNLYQYYKSHAFVTIQGNKLLIFWYNSVLLWYLYSITSSATTQKVMQPSNLRGDHLTTSIRKPKNICHYNCTSLVQSKEWWLVKMMIWRP